MTARVSRETPPVPPEAGGLFGSALPQMEAFAALLSGPAVNRGLLGPQEGARVWRRHLLNVGVVAAALPAGATVGDVGSGAGLPGVVWALLRPDAQVTLIEPLLRRSTFLQEVISALSLSNVELVRGRAQDLHGVRRFGVVAARAVAPLERLVGWCLPLVEPHGELIAFKGAGAPAELAAARPVLRSLGATTGVISTYGEGIVSPLTTVVRVRATGIRDGRRCR